MADIPELTENQGEYCGLNYQELVEEITRLSLDADGELSGGQSDLDEISRLADAEPVSPQPADSQEYVELDEAFDATEQPAVIPAADGVLSGDQSDLDEISRLAQMDAEPVSSQPASLPRPQRPADAREYASLNEAEQPVVIPTAEPTVEPTKPRPAGTASGSGKSNSTGSSSSKNNASGSTTSKSKTSGKKNKSDSDCCSKGCCGVVIVVVLLVIIFIVLELMGIDSTPVEYMLGGLGEILGTLIGLGIIIYILNSIFGWF